MRYDPFRGCLRSGRLQRRYKRFLADIELDDGEEVTAHCPNSGSMMGMAEPGSEVMVRSVDDPKRKLKWTWELVRPLDTDAWVGCNTMRPNAVVAWAIEHGHVPGLDAQGGLRREVPYGNSRIDLLLGATAHRPQTWVEVKNTTLADGSLARFPDAVTARGAKHMDELAAVAAGPDDAVVVFLVNRSDCDRFEPARDIDPGYGDAYDRAVEAGVRMLPLGVAVGPDGWVVRGELPHA